MTSKPSGFHDRPPVYTDLEKAQLQTVFYHDMYQGQLEATRRHLRLQPYCFTLGLILGIIIGVCI